jgi:Tfp pilus assembly PilM family ATPase
LIGDGKLARFLALDWDHQQLNLVEGVFGHGKVALGQAISLTESQSPNPAEAEALGRLLAERLKQAGIKPAPVLACIGRDRVIAKEAKCPAVAPSEEPALVRFQVVKELSDAADEVVIDYVLAGAPDEKGERRVLALVLRRELISTYQTLCRSAGLKLAGLCPRPFGSLASLSHALSVQAVSPPEPANGAAGMLTVGKPWAEFCILRDGELLFARSLAAGPTLARDIHRNLAVYAGQAPKYPVRTIYVAGGTEHAALRGSLQELEGVSVHSFDPFQGAEEPGVPTANRGLFSGAVGLLHLQAQRKALPINFIQPKEPKAARDPKRRTLALIGALAAILLLAAVAYGYAQIDSRDKELAALFEEGADLDHQLDRLSEDSKRLKAIDQWSNGEIVWLDELYDLTDRFPEIVNLRLVQLTADPLVQTAKSPYVGRIVLKGIMANDNQSVNKLEARLVNDGHYGVKAKVISRNLGADSRRFRQQFIQQIEIEKWPPEKYVRRMSDQPAEANGQSEGGFTPDFSFGGFPGGQP